MMTMADVNALEDGAFVETFRGLYEHSPWIVEAASALRPFDNEEAMLAAFKTVIADAGYEAQLGLLQAHPELAGKAAIDGTLTPESASEQSSAGLDCLTPDEYAEFHQLNDAYRAHFGFPFLICVRLANKAGILDAMRERLGNTVELEFETALSEIDKIVRLRLKEILA